MIVPFGKYKGCHIAKLKADRNYTRWLLAQDWLAEKWPRLAEAIGKPAPATMSTAQAPATVCPAGHMFGYDNDHFDACEDCPVWEACYYDQRPPPAPQAASMTTTAAAVSKSKFKPMSTETVQALAATWPKPLTILATRLAALPIDDAKASTRSPYARQSFLLALDELKMNLSALKALQVIVYELEYRPDYRELLYLVDRARDVSVEFARLRRYWEPLPAKPVATPRFGFRRGV